MSDVRVCCGEQSCHWWELQEKPLPRSASALGVPSEVALGWHEGAGEDRPELKRTRWNSCLALTAFDSVTLVTCRRSWHSLIGAPFARASERVQVAWQEPEGLH